MIAECEERCFCGAAWNDLAEECVDGHPFGEADKFRVRAEKAEARAEAAEHKLTQIRAIVENYNDHWQDFSAWSAMAAIEELKP